MFLVPHVAVYGDDYYIPGYTGLLCEEKFFFHQPFEGLPGMIKNGPFPRDRMYYGIIVREKGRLCYRLAVEQLTPCEAKDLNLEQHIIKRGIYLSSIVHNYLQDILEIERVFQHMLLEPGEKERILLMGLMFS